MLISNDLAENILLDWKKKNISPDEKSEFIKDLLKEKHVSMRELARQLDISHSTMQDWVSMRQKFKARSTVIHQSSIYSLADRLTFVLCKNKELDDRTIMKLNMLKIEIDKRLK